MLSLTFMIVLLVVPTFVLAWMLAKAVRAFGSPRGRLSLGLLAGILITLTSGALALGNSQIARKQPNPHIAILALVAVAQLAAPFAILLIVFKLRRLQTLALFGIVVAFGLAQLVFVFLAVRPFLLESMFVAANSMSPTLNDGDRFMVNKRLVPRRWDLMAYRSNDSNFCKRLVGLPGEQICFKSGSIEIDGQAVNLPAVLAGRCHASPVGMPPRDALYQDGKAIQLGADEYFFLGDNIDRSRDSRMEGPSNRSALLGVIDLIYWPPDRMSIVR